MAYQKTNWRDTIKDAQGNVVERGTPVNANNLNKIEGGLVEVTAQLADTTQDIGDLFELGNTPRSLVKSLKDISVNVKDRGVRGDGVTDDTAVIQHLFNTLPANTVLFFPNGTYKITNRLTWNGNISLIGQSRENTIIKAFATFDTLLYKKDEPKDCGRINNLTFDGDRKVDYVFDFPRGKGLHAYSNIFKNAKLRTVRIGSSVTWGAYEIYFYDNNVIGLQNYIGSSELMPDYAMEISANCSDSVFFKNIITNAREAGILSNGGHNDVHSNHIYGYPNDYIMKYCIKITTSVSNYFHNRCDTPLEAGIYVERWGNRIESNTIFWNNTMLDLTGKCGIKIDNTINNLTSLHIKGNLVEGHGSVYPPTDVVILGRMPRRSQIQGNFGNMISTFEKNYRGTIPVAAGASSATFTFTNEFSAFDHIPTVTAGWDSGGLRVVRALTGFTVYWKTNPTWETEIFFNVVVI